MLQKKSRVIRPHCWSLGIVIIAAAFSVHSIAPFLFSPAEQFIHQENNHVIAKSENVTVAPRAATWAEAERIQGSNNLQLKLNATTTNKLIANNESTRRRVHVVIVENRDLETEKSYGYYTFAMWQLYSHIRPECNLLAYNSSTICMGEKEGTAGRSNCVGYNGTRVAPYWMKVLAVRNAMDEANENDLIVFFDADSQILSRKFSRSLLELDEMKKFLNSGKTMMVIDERKYSYWYRQINKRRPGLYSAPIVSNQFAVINNKIGRQIMEHWWQSMNHPTPWDTSGKDMHWHWPWEQERLAAYYNATPKLFYPLKQSWTYMGFNHHGPFCCVRWHEKHDIIRTLNITLMNQTRTLPVLARWNGTSYEKLVSELFHQINVRTLVGRDTMRDASNEGFWRVWE